MLKSIRQIEETEDALMCSKKLQIESLLNAYASLDEDKQAAIYNIDSLREINADVQVASALRIQVDTLRSGEGGYSLLDEDTVKKLRADYEQMTDRQKRYFGEAVRCRKYECSTPCILIDQSDWYGECKGKRPH